MSFNLDTGILPEGFSKGPFQGLGIIGEITEAIQRFILEGWDQDRPPPRIEEDLSFVPKDRQEVIYVYMYRVAHNTAVKHIHRQVRTPQSAEIDVEALGQQLQAIEARLDRRRARQMLADLIRQLPAADRQLMLLYLEGLSSRDMAEITGMSPSNVTTRLSRIRTALGQKETS